MYSVGVGGELTTGGNTGDYQQITKRLKCSCLKLGCKKVGCIMAKKIVTLGEIILYNPKLPAFCSG